MISLAMTCTQGQCIVRYYTMLRYICLQHARHSESAMQYSQYNREIEIILSFLIRKYFQYTLMARTALAHCRLDQEGVQIIVLL